MSEPIDLKAIFGDPEKPMSESPNYLFHDHMDEVYVTDLPEDFPCDKLQTAIERIGHLKMPDLPEGVWFAGLDENRKTTMQMIFSDVVERDVAIEALTEAVDMVLAQNGYDIADYPYGMIPMTKQNYDEALIYANSLMKPSSSPQ